MLKTNCKEVKIVVQNYLLDSIRYDMDNETATHETAVQYAYNRFISEYGWNVRRIGEYNAFTEWLRGLALPVDFYYFDERALLEEWLEEEPEESGKYDDLQVDKLYWHLLTREFFSMARKYKIRKEV